MGTSTVPASPCTRHRPSVGLVGARRWPSTGCSRLGWASPGEAHARDQGVEEHAGNLPGMRVEQLARSRHVIEGQHQHVAQHPRRRAAGVAHGLRPRGVAPVCRRWVHARFGHVVGAVVGAFHLGDARPARVGAGGADGEHHRLGARIGKTDLLHRRQPVHQQLGQLDLAFRRQAHGHQLGGLLHDGAEHLGVGVTVDQRRVVVDVVQVVLAVDVGHPGATAALGIHRVGVEVHRVSRIAAGQHGLRSLEQRR
jgi:hypothetical protein